MTTNKHSCRLTIFEGPDGAGKTTAARAYADATNARYVHLGPLPRAGQALARLYAEAMLPAVLGLQDVVMDRCWLSEGPYGRAFRHGEDRLGVARTRMLERLALRCATTVVYADPGWWSIRAHFHARRSAELLADETQLHRVYHAYNQEVSNSALPVEKFDYQKIDIFALLEYIGRTTPHPRSIASAGSWDAPITLVGERFTDVTPLDMLYQWPFAGFSENGCSIWLARGLAGAGIQESLLRWVNADQDLALLSQHTAPGHQYVALGNAAEMALFNAGIPIAGAATHPQHHRRFKTHIPYPLFSLLKGLLP